VRVSLGDSHNYLAMFKQSNIAVVVRSVVHKPPELPDHDYMMTTEAEGPEGWNRAVLDIIRANK